MAIIARHFGALQNQSLGCWRAADNVANIAGTCWSPKETRVMQPYGGAVGAFRGGTTEDFSGSSNWITAGTYFYCENIHGANRDNVPVIWIEDSVGATELLIEAGGASASPFYNTSMIVYDASLVPFEIVDVFQEGKWHRVIVKMKRDNSSDIQIWVNGTLVLDGSSDMLGTSGIYTVKFGLHPHSVLDNPELPPYITFGGTSYVLEDDGANIDTNQDTVFGPYVDLGPYQSTDSTGTSDFGDNATGGTFGDSSELPYNASNRTRYTVSSGTPTLTGGVSCDGGSRPGPYGDANASLNSANIMMATWLWSAKKEVGGGATFQGRYGVTDQSTPLNPSGVIDTSSFGTMTTTAKWFRQVIGPDDTLPDPNNDVLQYGMKVVRVSGVSTRIGLLECFPHILQLEPTGVGPLVNRNGRLRSLVGGGLVG